MRAIKPQARKGKVSSARVAKKRPVRKRNPAPRAGNKPPKQRTLADLWARIDELVALVPKEEWAKIPSDLSYNHDHYLYGSPKK